MVPLVCALRAFGLLEAHWDGATRTATVREGVGRLRVGIGMPDAVLTTAAGSRTLAVDPPPALRPPGATTVPLAFLARLLGGTHRWNVYQGTASLTAPAHDVGLAEGEALLALLPAHPGGTPSARPFPQAPAVGIPLVVHLRDAGAEWVVPAPATAIEEWVRAEARAGGFTVSATGATYGPNQPTVVGLSLGLPGGQDLPQLAVSLLPLSTMSTLVRYDALVADLPPSPAAPPVPGGAASVTITEESPGGALAPPDVVTARALVQRLTTIADSLPVEAGVPVMLSCPRERASTLTHVRFAFAYPDGAVVTLDENVFCPRGAVEVRGGSGNQPPLFDPTLRLAAAAGLAVRG